MRIALFGCSRGLGAELVKTARNDRERHSLFLSARTLSALEAMAFPGDIVVATDFSQMAGQEKIMVSLQNFQPTHIVYIAGGGPFGKFGEKNWRDHEWAFAVNFTFPARLLHLLLSGKGFSGLKKFISVGSSIAGRSPDPKAASYAAAKHAMVGLMSSVQLESAPFELELFEPGYMDTPMLPPNAWPRQQGLVKSVKEEALRLWQLLVK